MRWAACCVVVLGSVTACATSATRDDATTARKPPPSIGTRDAAVATTDAGTDAATTFAEARPREVTAFYPVAEGACAAARTTAIEKTPTLVFSRRAWEMRPTDAHLLYEMPAPRYDAFVGAVTGGDEIIRDIGGTDDAHVWVIVGSHSGRGDDSAYLMLNGKLLKTPEGQGAWFAIHNVLPQPDGSLWAYGHHSAQWGIPGDPPITNDDSWQKLNRWFAWSAAGEPLKPNLPGPDMENAQRMETGEIVALSRSTDGRVMLARWSPTRKVSDLVSPEPFADKGSALQLGTKRAVLRPNNARSVFYNYDGSDKLVAAPINKRLKAIDSWLVTRSDQLLVTTSDGMLLAEAPDGTITEEKLPERARLASESSAPWLMGDSGVVYARTGEGWRKLVLPGGPWTAETHPAARIEWVKTLGDETWVSTVRIDGGFGQKKASEVRTFYVSSPRAMSLRCGSPYAAGELVSFPPKPDATCKELVVVLGRELAKDEKPSYPKYAAVLKDEYALGETLTFVDFGATRRLFGVLAPTPEVAAALVKKLAKMTPHEPEIVCGAADVQRRLTLKVKTGTFSVQP